jgi:hypothetical protein
MAKTTTEECRPLDAFQFAGLDWCRAALAGESRPVRGSTVWRDLGGGEAASIGWEASEGSLVLSYRQPLAPDAEVADSVPVELRRGRQAFFWCPGPGCGRRVRYLYLHGRYFRCRRCHGLAYVSQQWEWLARERAQEKARRREPRPALPAEEAAAEIARCVERESRERQRQRQRRYVQHTGRPGRPREKRQYRQEGSRKVQLGPGEAYCCKCRAARPYRYPRQAELVPHINSEMQRWVTRVAIRARCRVCNTPVFRIVRPEEAEGLQVVRGG